MKNAGRRTFWLAVGDILLILIVSIAGYLNHYAGREVFSLRWLSTFIPLCLTWWAAAGLSGLYSEQARGAPWQAAWRAGLAAGLAAPSAAMLRGLYLGAAVAPVFMLVLSAFSALGFGLWRGFWSWWMGRRPTDG